MVAHFCCCLLMFTLCSRNKQGLQALLTHSTFLLFYNLHVISLRLVESPPRYRLIASSYVNCYGSSFSHNTTQPNSSHRFLLYTAFNTDKYFISVGSISVECTEITLSSQKQSSYTTLETSTVVHRVVIIVSMVRKNTHQFSFLGWGLFGAILRLFRGYFWATFGLFCGYFRTILVLFCGYFQAIFGMFLRYTHFFIRTTDFLVRVWFLAF